MAVLVFMALVSFAKKDSPTTPAATSTPNATQTAVAGLSYNSLVSVPGGTFTQTDGTESFSHTISAFKMGQYEVTYELWYTVYQWAIVNGYTFANAGKEGKNGTPGAAPAAAKYEPVTTINWRDTIVWCNAYSLMTGLTPVYYSDSGFTTPIKNSTDGAYGSSINTTPGSFDNPYVNWNANGYRLPTEGEWQYAASYIDGSDWASRDFASGAGADYTDVAACTTVAWYDMSSGDVTHDVGGKTENSLDIYDMSGNVWERCWDWHGDYPPETSNYRGPASGSSRVIRGGSYDDTASSLRVGVRFISATYNEYSSVGLRFARNN